MRAVLAMLVVPAALLAAPAGAAQDTVYGRMVAARADAPSVATAGSARARYVLHCGGCHGLDGAGAPERYVPDLRQLGRFLRVEGGREFVIKVPGVMGSGLADPQVAEVTNWLLATLAAGSAPAASVPYTTDEVRRARAAPFTDVAGERQRLVERARALGLSLD